MIYNQYNHIHLKHTPNMSTNQKALEKKASQLAGGVVSHALFICGHIRSVCLGVYMELEGVI